MQEQSLPALPTLPTPQQAPAPAPTPAPAPAVPMIPGGRPVTTADVYRGYQQQRRELRQQLENLEEKRGELSGQLSDPMVGGANRAGLEKRITEIDQRISEVEKAIATTDALVASSSAAPGAVPLDRPPQNNGPPDEMLGALAAMFMLIVLLPISIAFARRIWRRSAAAVAAFPKELAERFTHLEQAVDAIAFEVERVGEGQRFATRYMTEEVPRMLGAGAAEPVEVKQREAVREARR